MTKKKIEQEEISGDVGLDQLVSMAELSSDEDERDLEGVQSSVQADFLESVQAGDEPADDLQQADEDGLQGPEEAGAAMFLEDCIAALRFYARAEYWRSSSPNCQIDSGQAAREVLEKYDIEF